MTTTREYDCDGRESGTAWCSVIVVNADDGRQIEARLEDDGRLTDGSDRSALVDALYALIHDARGTMDVAGYAYFLEALGQNEALWSHQDVERSEAVYVDVIDGRVEDAVTARDMAVARFGDWWPALTPLQDGQPLAVDMVAAEGGAA